MVGSVGSAENVFPIDFDTDENQRVFRCRFARCIFGREHAKELIENGCFSNTVWPEKADAGERIAGFGMGEQNVAESELTEAGQNDASDPRRVRHEPRR